MSKRVKHKDQVDAVGNGLFKTQCRKIKMDSRINGFYFIYLLNLIATHFIPYECQIMLIE